MNYEIHPQSGRDRWRKDRLLLSAAVQQRGTWRQPRLRAEKSAPLSTAPAHANHTLATGFPRTSRRGAASAIAACGASFVASTSRYRQTRPPHSYYH